MKRITGCALTIFMAGVVAFGYPGVMSAYWQNQFQVGVAETGMVVTFMLLALAVAMFFSGKVHQRFGMSVCVLIGLGFYLASFSILALARNIYWVYVWGFVANLGCSFWYGPGLTTGQQVMPEKKGLISGILNLFFGIAAAVMSPVLNRILDGSGYQTANLLLIVMLILAGILSCLLNKEPASAQSGILYKRTKEDDKDTESVKRVPYQEEKQNRTNADNLNAEEGKRTDLTVSQALKDKNFWLMWLIWAFVGAAGISMVSLSKSYALVLGMAGVALLTIFNLANGISRIIVGLCMDIIGGKITGMIAFAMAAAGYMLMPHFSGLTALAVCAIGVGIGFGTLFTISGPIAVRCFGLGNFGMIYGLIFTGYGLVGGIAGPAISGRILQASGGNYGIVFTYLGIMALIGAVLMFFVRE